MRFGFQLSKSNLTKTFWLVKTLEAAGYYSAGGLRGRIHRSILVN